MKTVFWILLFVFLMETETASSAGSRCEEITIPFCKKLGYNRTVFPNILEHDNQEEARRDAREFTSLVDSQCSPDIAYFLCSLYAPACTMMGSALPPCKSLCKSARNGCKDLMNNYGFRWPKSFSCNRFPKANERLCVGRNSTSSSEGPSKTSLKRSGNKSVFREKRCSSASGRGKFCCKLGRKAAKRGFYCNLRKKGSTETRRSIKFRKIVIRKCSKHSSCFRSCCKKRQRRRAAKRHNS